MGSVPDDVDRLQACAEGDYQTFLRLFQIACDVQAIVGVSQGGESMGHLRAERLKAMGLSLYGPASTVTLVSNGAGVLFVLQRDSLTSLVFEGVQFDLDPGEDVPVDLILKAVLETSQNVDIDDLKAILSSIKFPIRLDETDGIADINSGGLDIPGVTLTRSEFYTSRVLAMMMKTDIYEQGFYKKYVHSDRLGTTFTAVREGETATLTKINVLPDALSRPVKCDADIIGEDLFMHRRKGRKDRFRLSCAVSVNIWEEYESPEWFGYIHPPPNADAIRPADLTQLKERLEAYGVPDGGEVCRLVFHCLAHKSRNSNVKVDTLSAARGYFMYLKNFLKHGTTGTSFNHIVEGDELAVVYDGLAYRVSSPQTEIRHRSLFHSLLISDERERNGKNVPRRSILRRMSSTSEIVLSVCKDITYLNAEYDEEGGTLYSASAEEENVSEAWATCTALYACDGYGSLEGCFNCAIESRRGAIVDESAVFTNDVQVPVVFDKLFRKNSIAEEMSGMSEARGPTYPGAFISGRDQCNERTFLAGKSHNMTSMTLASVLRNDLRLKPIGIMLGEGRYVAEEQGATPASQLLVPQSEMSGATCLAHPYPYPPLCSRTKLILPPM
ncbi:unnamed protein product [Chondrus crispus]|uniref:Uncharacterized protein n=1 Tax=Chondrus crispus TaxID=2769 RepID=R7Q8Q2_CHOCR|nr:unnamed protein product [Chondrus crispus]CDF33855.1 unnamed protein product [Chondrus crispus]|eukprot:XP_005713674.1 unnamed protein product [Chondrus crispus]